MRAATWTLTAMMATGVLSTTSPAGGALHAAERPDSAQSGAASSVPEARDGLLFASPTTRDHIGRVVVPVMVNGRGPFRFIVDTGANHSTISSALVQTLGLKPAETASITLHGITGAAQVSFVTIDKLQAGDLTLEETVLPVVWTPVLAGADGIFGAAGLTEKSLLIDFQRNRVVISPHVEGSVRSSSIKIHALRPTHGLITLETQVSRVPVVAVIDTGSERTLGNLALRDALKARRGAGTVAYVTSVYGATKEVEPGEIQKAPPISIGLLHITDVAIVYGNFHIFKVWDMQEKPAMIIGMDVLGTVASLGIDFRNQDVYVASVRSSDDAYSWTHGTGNLGSTMQHQ